MSKVGSFPEIFGRVTFHDIVIEALDIEADNEVRLLDEGQKVVNLIFPENSKRSSRVS